MADAATVKWIYPPDMQDGSWDEKSGNRKVIVQLSCLSDGTGESEVVKVALSDLKTQNGKIPSRTAIEYIQYSINGMDILLEWDRAPRAEICRISGSDSGEFNWKRTGGNIDPGGDDRTGDILLTTTNADNGDSYDITICIRLKE